MEAIDERTCLLHTGGESLGNLAAFLGTLAVDFDVLYPPELRAVVRDVAARFTRAAGSAPGRVAVHPGADVAVEL
ncbi:hypothetical protein ACLQ3F_29035 [Micromonospora sp. DT15]|uniref:hypothetical protein n=1 Tax=Micromonospora sp. DT15 TaxID=3393445 RepID=UPI003CE90209